MREFALLAAVLIALSVASALAGVFLGWDLDYFVGWIFCSVVYRRQIFGGSQ